MSEETKLTPACETMLLCDLAVRSDKGIISLINVIDGVISAEYPVVYPKICLFVRIDNVYENDVVQISITPPDIAREVLSEKTLDDLKGVGKHQSVLVIEPFYLPSAGDYILFLSVNGIDIGSRTLSAVLVPEGEAE